jgi:hypothetical protein
MHPFGRPVGECPTNGVTGVDYGDWSRYFVGNAEGLRFERSDEFRFQNDLVAFRAVIRINGAAGATPLVPRSRRFDNLLTQIPLGECSSVVALGLRDVGYARVSSSTGMVRIPAV